MARSKDRSYRNTNIAPGGQDTCILPAWLSDLSAGFALSCLLVAS